MPKKYKRLARLEQHRSKHNTKLGHVIAIIDCGHREYLGMAMMPGKDRVLYPDTVNIIRIETYEIADKFSCKECPYEAEFFDNFQVEIDEIMNIMDAVLD